MKLVHATWEKVNIGVDTYEFVMGLNDSLDGFFQAEHEAVAAGAEYIVVKIPINDPSMQFALSKAGYVFIETVFHIMITNATYTVLPSVARFDRGIDVNELVSSGDQQRVLDEIRKGIFSTDRISCDPYFKLAQANNRYANWLASMLLQGDRLFEISRKDQPMGFFAMHRLEERTIDPILIGMYLSAQKDLGMGVLLHKKLLDTCFASDCDKIVSTVVSNNLKVLRINLRCGATIEDMTYTYIKHI